MAILLEKIFNQISDYVQKHESNYTIIEDSVNSILVQLGGASGSLSVPLGLQEIFDRDGVIGIDSYQLTDQTVVADTLTIPAGAAWLVLSFRKKSTTTALNTSALVTGTRYINVDSGGFPNLSDTQTAESVYSFEWDSGTDIISATTLLIDILFDGDDFNDALTSLAQAKNFTSMADRFEDIESQLGVMGAMYQQDDDTTTGLDFGYKSGVVRNDNVIATTAASTITMTASDINFIEVTPSTGTITTNLVGFTSLRIPLFEVTTDGSGITAVLDRRTWASLGGGGGGGGHAQNTDIGTDAAEFKMNLLEAGAPTKNASFKNERGSSPDVDIRWNETTNIWEFTNDGTIYSPIGAPNLGVQELSKFVSFEDPPLVVDLSGVTGSGIYEDVDLTADGDFSGIISGVQGMMLRIQFEDSAPTASTIVLIQQIENPVASPAESMRVFAADSADYNDKEGHVILTPGQGLDMSDNFVLGFRYNMTSSGSNTASMKIFVLGYWDKVTGVGTQNAVFSHVGEDVLTTATDQLDLTGFANRALIHEVILNETGGLVTGQYNIKFYSKDTFLAADLVYQLDNVDPVIGPPNARDTLPFVYVDDDETGELHVSIENTDGSNTGTYDLTIRMEKFS